MTKGEAIRNIRLVPNGTQRGAVPNPDYPRWSRKRIEETCWELLMNGYLNCEDLIDPVVTFANSPESYMQYVDQHPEQSIKMGVTF